MHHVLDSMTWQPLLSFCSYDNRMTEPSKLIDACQLIIDYCRDNFKDMAAASKDTQEELKALLKIHKKCKVLPLMNLLIKNSPAYEITTVIQEDNLCAEQVYAKYSSNANA